MKKTKERIELEFKNANNVIRSHKVLISELATEYKENYTKFKKGEFVNVVERSGNRVKTYVDNVVITSDIEDNLEVRYRLKKVKKNGEVSLHNYEYSLTREYEIEKI